MEIVGLVKAAQYNGSVAAVKEVLGGRLLVVLQGEKDPVKEISVKVENVKPAAAGKMVADAEAAVAKEEAHAQALEEWRHLMQMPAVEPHVWLTSVARSLESIRSQFSDCVRGV